MLAGLRFAAWPELPPKQERRPAAPASTASRSCCGEQTDGSEGEGGASVECRPCKKRVLSSAGGGAAGMLARRTYTWRGIRSRRAEKQLRQLDALQQQPQGPPTAAPSPAASPAPSSCSPDTPAGSGVAAAAAAAEPWPQQCVQQQQAPAGSGDGHRDWAALTTWLRQNVHKVSCASRGHPLRTVNMSCCAAAASANLSQPVVYDCLFCRPALPLPFPPSLPAASYKQEASAVCGAAGCRQWALDLWPQPRAQLGRCGGRHPPPPAPPAS